MDALRPSEWLVLVWSAVAVAVALTRPLLPGRRLRIVGGAIVLAVIVVVVANVGATGPAGAARNLAPALYVLATYALCSGLLVSPQPALERWLVDADRRWLGAWHPEHWLHARRVSAELLEIAYFAVYAMLPLGLWAAWAGGGDRAVDWYWCVVFPAEALCYLALAWLQTRPPRALEPWTATLRRQSPVRVANEFVLARASHRMNTIPSGHAAGAVAVALALLSLQAPLAFVFVALAVAICVATVVGRYHFLADTVAGAVVAVVVWGVVLASGL